MAGGNVIQGGTSALPKYKGAGSTGAPSASATVNVLVSGQDQLDALQRRLDAIKTTIIGMSRGGDYLKYWKDTEKLVADAGNALKNFNDALSSGNKENASGYAVEFIKTINAVKAGGADIQAVFKGITDTYGKTIDELVRETSGILSGDVTLDISAKFDPSKFREAFAVFKEFEESLKNSGISVAEVLSGLSNPSDLANLISQIDEANAKITEMSGTIEAYKAQVADLQRRLVEAGDESGLNKLKAKVDMFTKAATSEFSAFLRVNNLSTDNADVKTYFDSVANGSMTASKAITELKSKFTSLFTGSEGEGVSQSALTHILSLLEEVKISLAEVKQTIDEIQNGGVTVKSGEASKSSLDEVASSIKDIGENSQESYASAKAFLDNIKDFADGVSADKLNALSVALSSIARVNGFKVSDKQLAHLTAFINDVGNLQTDFGKLRELSQVNLSNFSSLTISSTPLKALATYLPTIAGIYPKNLEKLSAINFANLSALKISQGQLEGLQNVVKNVSDLGESFGTGLINSLKSEFGTFVVETKEALAELFSFNYINPDFERIQAIADEVKNRFENTFSNLSLNFNVPENLTDVLKAATEEARVAAKEASSVSKSAAEMTGFGYSDTAIAEARHRLETLGIDSDSIDKFIAGLDEAGIKITSISERFATASKEAKGLTKIVVNGVNQYGDAVKYTTEYSKKNKDMLQGTLDVVKKFGNTTTKTTGVSIKSSGAKNNVGDISGKREYVSLLQQEQDLKAYIAVLDTKLSDGTIDTETRGAVSAARDDANKRLANLEAEIAATKQYTLTAAERSKIDEKAARSAEKRSIAEASMLDKESNEAQKMLDSKYDELDSLENKINKLRIQLVKSPDNPGLNDQLTLLESSREAILEQIDDMRVYGYESGKATEIDTNRARRLAELTAAQYKSSESVDKTAESLRRLNTLQNMARTAAGYTSAAGTDAYSEIMKINDQINNMIIGGEDGLPLKIDQNELDKIEASLRRNVQIIKALNLDSQSWIDTMQSGAKKFTSWLSVSQIIMRAVRYLRQMVDTTIQLDAAMTELRKVTDETQRVYEKFLISASKRSKEIGATIYDVVNASADFARLGYSIGESEELSMAAMVYKNVGDGIDDISEATQSIISTMKAFGLEASDAMSIVDRFNEVGNNFAITSQGIGDALVRSASALAAANNTLDESIALITAANGVVQNPQTVGTSLKTISMFLRAAKTEAEEAGEDTDGMAESVSKLRAELLALTGGKVDIQIDDDTFKSTYQILQDISRVWDDLTDISRANILNLIGGKRNSNVTAAIIENFSTAEDVLNYTANASGSALKENDKYLDSISGRLSVIKSILQDISINTAESWEVKAVLDFAKAILSVIDALSKLRLLLPTVFASIDVVNGIKSSGKIRDVVNRISDMKIVDGKLEGDIVGLTNAYQSFNKTQQDVIQKRVEEMLLAKQMSEIEAKETAQSIANQLAKKKQSSSMSDLASSVKSVLSAFSGAFGETTVNRTKKVLTKVPMSDLYQKAFDDFYNSQKGSFVQLIDTYQFLLEKTDDIMDEIENDVSEDELLNIIRERYERTDRETAEDLFYLDHYKEYFGKGKFSKRLAFEEIDQQVTKTTFSFDKLKASLKGVFSQSEAGFKLSIPTKITLIISAVTLLVKAIKWLSEAQERAYEKASKLREKYDEYVGSVQEYTDQIEENNTRISELEKIAESRNITFVEQDELDRLKEANELLVLTKKNAEALQASAAEDTNKALEKAFDRLRYGGAGAGATFFGEEGQRMKIDNLISLYQNASDKFDEAVESGDSKYAEKLEKTKNEYATQLRELFDLYKTDYYDKFVGEGPFKESIHSLMETISLSLDPVAYLESKLLGLSGETKKAMSDMSADGELTAEEISYLTGKYEGLEEVLALFNGDAQKVADYFNAMSDDAKGFALSVDTATDSVNVLSDAIEALENLNKYTSDVKDEFDAMTGTVSSLNETIDKLKSGESLTAEEALKLSQDYPELVDSLKKVEDGYTLNVGAVIMLRNAVVESERSMLSSTIESVKGQIQANKALSTEYANQIQGITNLAEAEKALSDFRAQSSGLAGIDVSKISEISYGKEDEAPYAIYEGVKIALTEDGAKALEAKKNLDELLNTLVSLYKQEEAMSDIDWSSFGVTKEAEDAVDYLDEVNNKISELSSGIDSLNSALYSLDKEEELSSKDVLSLIQQYPVLASALEKTENGYRFNRQAVINLREAEIQAARDSIEASIKAAKQKVISSQNVIKSIGSEISAVSSLAEAEVLLAKVREQASFGGSGNNPSGLGKKFTNTFVATYVDSSGGASPKRYDELLNQLESLRNMYAQLDAYDNIDWTTFGIDEQIIKDREDAAKDSTKEVEEYIAEIEKFRRELENLKLSQRTVEDYDREINESENIREQINLRKQLIESLRQEQTAQHALNEARDAYIKQSSDRLRRIGFDVSYDSTNNEFFVSNLEHINDLVATNKGEYETLQEATNEYRKEIEALIKECESLNDENESLSQNWWSLQENIRSTQKQIIEDLKSIVTEASNALDTIQGVYDTLQSAADEFEANGGFISIDTFQSIINLGAQYMQYLKDENGMLAINRDTIEAVIKAKTEELAVNQALTYVERIEAALQPGAVENLNELLFATTSLTGATWDLVYAKLESLNLDDEQYQAAKHNIDSIRGLMNTTIQGIGDISASYSDRLEHMKDGMEDIIGYVKEMLKDLNEQQIEALEKEKDQFDELIDKRKELLDDSKSKSEYEDSVSEQVESIAKIRSKINALSLDDSREANAKRIKLEEELSEATKKLAETQSDHAIDVQKDELDNMKEAYDEEKDSEIEKLKEKYKSEQELHDAAIAYIEENYATLYDQLISWNTEYGSHLNTEISSAWDACDAAVQKYGSYLEAVKQTTEELARINGSIDWTVGTGDTSGNIGAKKQNDIVGRSGKSDDEIASELVYRMYQNSKDWITTEDQSARNSLHDENNRIARVDLPTVGVTAVYDPNSGTWYIDRVGGVKLFDKYKSKFPKYHTGGIVGQGTTDKQGEVLALLKKGEAVLTEQQETGLYKVVDFFKLMSERLGKVIDGELFNKVMGGSIPLPLKSNMAGTFGMQPVQSKIDKIEINAPIQVVQRLDDAELKRCSDTIGSLAAKYIREGFRRGGTNAAYNPI